MFLLYLQKHFKRCTCHNSVCRETRDHGKRKGSADLNGKENITVISSPFKFAFQSMPIQMIRISWVCM